LQPLQQSAPTFCTSRALGGGAGGVGGADGDWFITVVSTTGDVLDMTVTWSSVVRSVVDLPASVCCKVVASAEVALLICTLIVTLPAATVRVMASSLTPARAANCVLNAAASNELTLPATVSSTCTI